MRLEIVGEERRLEMCSINFLEEKRKLYLKTQSVPRSKQAPFLL